MGRQALYTSGSLCHLIVETWANCQARLTFVVRTNAITESCFVENLIKSFNPCLQLRSNESFPSRSLDASFRSDMEPMIGREACKHAISINAGSK
jgi:hypothetical protein